MIDQFFVVVYAVVAVVAVCCLITILIVAIIWCARYRKTPSADNNVEARGVGEGLCETQFSQTLPSSLQQQVSINNNNSTLSY